MNNNNHGRNDTQSSSKAAAAEAAWNFTYDTDLLGQSPGPCTIDRYLEAELSFDTFQSQYWRQQPVIVVRQPNLNRPAQEKTTKESLLQTRADTMVRLATYQSYAFQAQEQYTTLQDYLESQLVAVTLETSGNTTYAFGKDPYGLDAVYQVPRVVQIMMMMMKQKKEHLSSSSVVEQQQLQQQQQEWHLQTALSASGGGLAFHWHADVFAETLHGTRRWFLFPPNQSSTWFSPRAPSLQWFYHIYQQQSKQQQQQQQGLLECTLHQNEAIYVPADWLHATLSLGEAVSVTTSFAATFRRDVRNFQRALLLSASSNKKNDDVATAATTASTTTTRATTSSQPITAADFDLDPASVHHIAMLDAFGERNYPLALQLADLLTKERSESFIPWAWLGVIATTAAPVMGKTDSQTLQKLLLRGKYASQRCTELNPLYAPCYVWLSRQLRALGLLLAGSSSTTTTAAGRRSSHGTADDLFQKAAQARAKAAEITYADDDEILDPRWKPRGSS